MATKFQCEHGQARPIAFLTRNAGVHLLTPKGTMTSKYEAVMRHQATYPGLYKHLQERNGWTTQVMTTINWKAHGTSLRKQIKRKTHYTKLVHGILPTCKTLHRSDPIRRQCPLCKLHTEDWTHILRCNHPKRGTWRLQTLTHVSEKCKKLRTRPALQQVLNDALAGWFTSEEQAFQLDPTGYQPEVQCLIIQQNAIGWHHLFLGRFSNEWSTLQDIYYIRVNEEDRQKKMKLTGQRWQVTMIGFLWEQWWAVWESRNKDLHGEDAKSRAPAESRDVHRTLHELYDMRHRADPHVQTVYHTNATDHQSKTLWYNQNWIAVHGPLIRENVRQATARAKAGMRSIRQYLIPLR